jgi:hypothetical protein
MRLRRHALRPALECCESRSLMSGGLVSAPVSAATDGVIIKLIELDGTFRGHYHSHNGNPDTGSVFDLRGSGHVQGFGHAFVTGHIQAIGFIALGHAQGTLFVSGVKGTLTLGLTGATQHDGPKGLPDVFTFEVTGGTGAYTNDSDNGLATLVTIPKKGTTSANNSQPGKFTLVLTSDPVPFM